MRHSRRLRVIPEFLLPARPNGTAHFQLIDTTDGQVITRHDFEYPAFQAPLDTPVWFNAQLKIAQALCDALNAAPSGAIEYIRQSLREAHHLKELAERTRKDRS